MMDRVPGQHITFVDPRHHHNPAALSKHARELVALFRTCGAAKSRVIVSVSVILFGLTGEDV